MTGPDPEPTYEVRRAGLFCRLVDEEHIGLLDAEHWLRAWERESEGIEWPRGSQSYWDEALRWIIGERSAKRRQSN